MNVKSAKLRMKTPQRKLTLKQHKNRHTHTHTQVKGSVEFLLFVATGRGRKTYSRRQNTRITPHTNRYFAFL